MSSVSYCMLPDSTEEEEEEDRRRKGGPLLFFCFFFKTGGEEGQKGRSSGLWAQEGQTGWMSDHPRGDSTILTDPTIITP